MAEEVIIEGVEEVKQNLNDVLTRKIPAIVTNVMRAVTKAIEEEAKRNCPVDTGALRGSIEGEVTKVDYPKIEGVVGAGKPEYARGAGSFVTSTKSGKKVSPEATTEYAEKVERKTEFMTKTFVTSPNKFKSALVKQLKEYLA